jgi:hypothetical protein
MNHRKWSRSVRLAGMSLTCLMAICGWSRQNPYAAHAQSACSTLIDPLLSVPTRYRAVRAIEDRGTHQQWLLVKDLSHPSAPALLVQAPGYRSRLQPTEFDSCSSRSVPRFSLPVIHVGDPIIVSEHTAISDAQLGATALEAAAAGEPLNVRLKIGGQILHAIANAPGRATRIVEASEMLR